MLSVQHNGLIFSVAIPAFKPQFLDEAVSSVLAQNYKSWELVIVDDFSPYDLRAIVEPYLSDPRVRYFRNDSNIGAYDVVDNWNRCLEYCKGDYVICIGDDDRLLPNCLDDLSKLISAHPDLGVYHIQTEIIDDTGAVIRNLPARPEYETDLDLLDRRWRRGSCQYIGDFCFYVPGLRAKGGFFKTPLAWGADDITAYLASKDGIANTLTPGFQYRFNSNSLSSNNANQLKYKTLIWVADWFATELDSYKAQSVEDEQKLKALKKRLRPYFNSLCHDYVVSDIGGSLSTLGSWWKHRKEYNLSASRLLLLATKGIIFRFVRKI